MNFNAVRRWVVLHVACSVLCWLNEWSGWANDALINWVSGYGAQKQAFIDRWIERPRGYGPEYARLIESGTPVWALVGHMRGVGVWQAADDYQIPREAADAAWEYYRKHRKSIDARLLLNEGADDEP